MHNSRLIYAGIGSRDTPDDYLIVFEKIGEFLAKQGFTLRSGGSSGADSAFENGCLKANGLMELYLPWENFNNHYSKHSGIINCVFQVDSVEYNISKTAHPNWEKLTEAGKKLITRNVYQVLGMMPHVSNKSCFIICWTKEGKMLGGTSQALRIAKQYNIPVINAGNFKEPKHFFSLFGIWYKSVFIYSKTSINDVSIFNNYEK